MLKIIAVARKELNTYFSAPTAFIFLGTFLVVNLFIFFWVETFFARNLVDIRPLFNWMPVLLIFLVAALTMKMWSEERRLGTLESLMTLPAETYELVAGKFLACMGLVSISLLLTLWIPLTVSFLGDLDWGPVIGAYVASILLAGAYTSMGLFVSARTDNQIVSLIITVLLCFLFFLIGTNTFSGFFGHSVGEILKLLGTGSRFESVERGVLDLRDVYYYVSLMGTFMVLNVFHWKTQMVRG